MKYKEILQEEPPSKLPRMENVRELPRRERKSYSQLKRSFWAEVLRFEFKKVCSGLNLEDVRIRLNRGKRKRNSEEEVNRPTSS